MDAEPTQPGASSSRSVKVDSRGSDDLIVFDPDEVATQRPIVDSTALVKASSVQASLKGDRRCSSEDLLGELTCFVDRVGR